MTERKMHYKRKITERQEMILRELAQGKTNAEIGHSLGISSASMSHTINILCDIFKVASREELAERWVAQETRKGMPNIRVQVPQNRAL